MSDIGDYQEIKYLGCGGFGTVSLVTCRQDGRQVSIPTTVGSLCMTVSGSFHKIDLVPRLLQHTRTKH